MRGDLAAHCSTARTVPDRRMTAAQYYLKPNAFICPARRHWVILDVKQDRYLCLDKEEFEALWPWLNGCQRTGSQESVGAARMPPDTARLAAELVAREILSESAHDAKPATPTASITPTRCLAPAVAHPPVGPRLLHAPAFLRACAIADARLRVKSIESTVRFITRRKQKCSKPDEFDWSKAARLISTFESLRLFYPRPYLCLFDSLALLDFLSHYSLFPTWVFGVIVEPFQAHCWLQQDDVVINDTVERVQIYSPIMCI